MRFQGSAIRRKILSFAAAGILTCGITLPAIAQNVNQCIDRCFSVFSPMQNNGSTELRDECLQQCNTRSTPSVPHGAIAFGASSASWGISYGKGSTAAANQSAMAACLENGSDCRLVVSYTNTCAALATVRSKAKFATAQASTFGDAKAAAMKACQAQLGAGCKLWVSLVPGTRIDVRLFQASKKIGMSSVRSHRQTKPVSLLSHETLNSQSSRWEDTRTSQFVRKCNQVAGPI